jgi:hypothetical protein
MEVIRLRALHLAARATFGLIGAALLWYGVGLASVLGLIVMLIGLICAVSGFLAGDTVPRALDVMTERLHAEGPRRTAA